MSPGTGRFGTEDLDAREIADALWLASRIAAAAPPRPVPVSPDPPPAPGPPPEPLAASAEEPPAAAAVTEPAAELPRPSPEATRLRWRVQAASSARSRRPAPRDRPVPPELPGGLAKAMRPLNRLVPARRGRELDEEATATAVAETGRWLPVYREAAGHPFEIVLVTDRGSAMRIWERTVSAFRVLLERQGAFEDVKAVSVNTDEKDVRTVETAPGVHWPISQLADPTGRRILLVLTDGVGAAWRSGAMARALAGWARTCRVALVDLLPPDRWAWSGLAVRSRVLRTTAPAAGAPVPVLALDRRYVGRWADLIAGDGSRDVRLPVLLPFADEEPLPEPEIVAPADRLSWFRASATPGAVRLAALLAAAPLTLRVMHAVQGTMMPESAPAQLAEVLLGRLLHRVPEGARRESGVDYEFAPGLRPELLASATRDETAQVQRVVEDVLGPECEPVSDLREVLRAPDSFTRPDVNRRTAAFLRVQHDVLVALAGPYARRASRMGEALDEYHGKRNDPERSAIEPDAIPSRAVDRSASETIQKSRGNSVTDTSLESALSDIRPSAGQPAVWGGVPLRNVNFIGREDLLDSLHSELTGATATAKAEATAVLPGALHGMGGIGKSQIAVEYVYRHIGEYDLIWWIPSENPSEIQASLVKLAQRLGLPVERSVDTAVPAVLEALRTGEPFRRWLLVFDNADKPKGVREFWPRGGAGHIIVTSRNPQWSEVAQAVEVDVFQRAESRELLQRRNVDLVDRDADRLAEVLGDLPLAVEQAAAWRAETGMAADEYLELFEDKRTELLESRPPADYEVAVEAAWNVSLDRLRTENPGALELLEVCAFFSPEPISRSLFSGVRNIPVAEALERTLADPIRLGRAIREITRYSLAKIDHRTDTIQLHRLVQLVLRNKLSPDEQIRVRHTAHLLLANRDPKKPDSVDYWPRYAELLPHIRVVDARNCTDEWVRRMAINAVNYLFAFGDPAGALELASDFARFWSEKLGEKHADVLVVSRWWARSLRALGRFEEARLVAQRTLELMRETLGGTHEETLLTMHTVASDLRAKGDFAAARDMNRAAYEAAVSRFGEDDPDTLAAANNYALSLRLAGDLTAARDLDEQTWQRKRTVLGEDHRHTLLTLDNWSVDLRETGDYLRARTEQEDTVRRMRGQLGDGHPMTLSAIKNLAVACRKAGRHGGRALSLAREAADGFVTRYGEAHPDAMSASMDLSIEHRQDNNLDEARRLGMHVKELYERTWGARHPFSLAAATNLAVTLRLLGELTLARELNEKAFRDMGEVLGKDHPFTLVCATNYASDLAKAGEYEAALSLDEKTLARSERVLGEDHPSSLALVVNLALDLRGLGRDDEADTKQFDAIQRLNRVLGGEHPATNDALLNQRANCDIDPMQV